MNKFKINKRKLIKKAKIKRKKRMIESQLDSKSIKR